MRYGLNSERCKYFFARHRTIKLDGGGIMARVGLETFPSQPLAPAGHLSASLSTHTSAPTPKQQPCNSVTDSQSSQISLLLLQGASSFSSMAPYLAFILLAVNLLDAKRTGSRCSIAINNRAESRPQRMLHRVYNRT